MTEIPTPAQIQQRLADSVQDSVNQMVEYIIPHLMRWRNDTLEVDSIPDQHYLAYQEFQRLLAEKGWILSWDNDVNPPKWRIRAADCALEEKLQTLLNSWQRRYDPV
jgi:hypothetical protein